MSQSRLYNELNAASWSKDYWQPISWVRAIILQHLAFHCMFQEDHNLEETEALLAKFLDADDAKAVMDEVRKHKVSGLGPTSKI